MYELSFTNLVLKIQPEWHPPTLTHTISEVFIPHADLTCMWPVGTWEWVYYGMDALFWRTLCKVQAGSTHTWKLDGALFSLASVTWRQAVQRPTLSLSLLEMTQALESPGHRDFRKMCPGRSPRFQVHGDRITEDHRYVEFWFIHTLSLSVPSCARCWRCSIINITLNS
jgi:hypothetical protein